MKYCVLNFLLLPAATWGLKHLILCIDTFTKPVKVYAISRPTNKAIINVIVNKYIPEHGQVKRVLTDPRAQFQNKVWSDTLAQHGICLLYTSVPGPFKSIKSIYGEATRATRDAGC